MESVIELGDITVDVTLKDIKNIHLSVYPPNGRVHISAPLQTDMETIRIFAISKLSWIKTKQRKLVEQERETLREYVDRESHYVWGKRYLLKLLEENHPPKIDLHHDWMELHVRPGATILKKQSIVDEWYRQQLRLAAQPLTALWESKLGVKVERIFIRHMKTKWGSCNHKKHNVRLNTELAKKPKECLEYIIVHEIVHLIEPTHNSQFVSLMDHYLPYWKILRDELNGWPLGHVTWKY